MVFMFDVAQFVDDDVINHLFWHLHQVAAEVDTVFAAAASPARFRACNLYGRGHKARGMRELP
jgi:hypothetical protein